MRGRVSSKYREERRGRANEQASTGASPMPSDVRGLHSIAVDGFRHAVELLKSGCVASKSNQANLSEPRTDPDTDKARDGEAKGKQGLYRHAERMLYVA